MCKPSAYIPPPFTGEVPSVSEAEGVSRGPRKILSGAIVAPIKKGRPEATFFDLVFLLFRLSVAFQLFASFLINDFHRQAGFAAIIKAHQFDVYFIAFFDDVSGFFWPTIGQL